MTSVVSTASSEYSSLIPASHSRSTCFFAPIMLLPSELFSMMFALVLGNYWVDPTAYTKRRLVLILVCRRWRMLVFADSFLWNQLFVTILSSISTTRSSLTHIGSSPISLHLELERDANNHSALSTVESVLNVFPRCRRLSIDISDVQAMHIIANSLALTGIESVEVLSITNLCPFKSSLLEPRMVNSSYNLSKLRRLRIVRVWFNWDLIPTFSALTTLVLCEIHALFAPTWSIWTTLQRLCTGLERLCLADIGCLDIPSSPPPLLFPRITYLDLVVSTDTSTAYELVAALDVPAVVHIIYESDDDATLLCLMERHHTLDKVTHFTLNVGAATEQILHALLSRLPALSSLDVLASDLRILDAFFVGDKFSSTMVCPNLTHLMLEEESPTDVRHFMEQRCVHGSAKPLQQVIFRPDLDTNDPDFQWLKERVELFVDIPFKAPKWISNGKFYAEND